MENVAQPKWTVTLPRNVVIPAESSFRIELWDRDTPVTADPIGKLVRSGLPTAAQPDAEARLLMDTGAVLTFRISAPVAHEGVGVTSYEIRNDHLRVLAVEKHSPAGRAGVEVNDMILAIDGLNVSSLKPAKAATLLSMSAKRGYVLTVTREGGEAREITLDRGLVWLTM
jgi:hypothetical protein